MYILISILLMTSLVFPTLTAPPPRLGTQPECGGNIAEHPPPNPDDCIGLLHAIREGPWVQQATTFNWYSPSRGAVPHYVTYRTCQIFAGPQRWTTRIHGEICVSPIFSRYLQDYISVFPARNNIPRRRCWSWGRG